jgi:hypothetical protein
MVSIAVPTIAQTFASAKSADHADQMYSPIIMPASGAGEYKISYPPGFRMRNVGRTMTVAGAALLVGGIAVYSNADKTVYTVYTSSGTYDEYDPKLGLGLLMIMGGTGLTVPGIILWSKGARKFNRYVERQTACVWNGSAISLHYRF